MIVQDHKSVEKTLTGKKWQFFLEFTITILPGPGNYPHGSPICEHELRHKLISSDLIVMVTMKDL